VPNETELGPAMKIFAWRGDVTRTALVATSTSDRVPIIADPVLPATLSGGLVMNANAFSEDVLKRVAAALKAHGSVSAATEATPSQSIVETGVAEDFVEDEAGSEECADYTLRAWKDGELIKHLIVRLKKVRALEFMRCSAANLPLGRDVALYADVHEQAANIPIAKPFPRDGCPSARQAIIDWVDGQTAPANNSRVTCRRYLAQPPLFVRAPFQG
jgi:hypothetical protein